MSQVKSICEINCGQFELALWISERGTDVHCTSVHFHAAHVVAHCTVIHVGVVHCCLLCVYSSIRGFESGLELPAIVTLQIWVRD